MAHDTAQMESKLRTIDTNLSNLAGLKVSEKLIQIIHRPGWTTPAESMLVHAMLDSLHRHVEMVAEHSKRLLEAAEQVGKK